MSLFGFGASSRVREHRAKRDRALCSPIDPASSANLRVTSLAELPRSETALQDGDQDILSSDMAGIVEGIKEKRWTASRVLHCFIRSARRAHERTNCLTEVCFEQAIDRAAQLDKHFAATGELVGPLHGLPMSFKDQFPVIGTQVTIGYSSWLDRPASDINAAMVRIATHLGAVPFCKTNVPQTMLSFECSNPLWGRTLNPRSKAHTSGGSSGGESALMASDGAACGFGSDIGGSLRIPVAYSGAYSLKPSLGRWPAAAAEELTHGFEGIHCVVGPICRSAADVELITRNFISALHPEPDVNPALTATEIHESFGAEQLYPLPLRPTWFDPLAAARLRGPERPLRIGYYACDGFIRPSPACIRAVDEAVDALRRKHGQEIQLVEIAPKELRAHEALSIFQALTSADGYEGLTRHLKSDRLESSLYLPVYLARIPGLLRRLIIFIAKYVLREWMLALIVSASRRKSTKDYISWVGKRDDFIADFNKRVWVGHKLDGIIAPVQASPALPHGATAKLSMLASGTILYNVLDSSIAICPVTQVDPVRDSAVKPKANASAEEKRRYEKWRNDKRYQGTSKMVNWDLYGGKVYDAQKMAGLPVGLQIVARPNEDEKAIGLMRLLDDALGPRRYGPGKYTKEMYNQS